MCSVSTHTKDVERGKQGLMVTLTTAKSGLKPHSDSVAGEWMTMWEMTLTVWLW